MIRDMVDQQIVDYLNRNSTRLKHFNSIEIAQEIGLPENDIFDRCQFLMQKQIIKERGMGCSIEQCYYYIP